jgi:CheY-like chemotaxis protein
MNGWILVVDDDDDVRDTIMLLLESQGRQVAGATDGLVALEEMARRGRPALVLLDLRMPRMNGAELAQAMHADPQLATVPIVILSGDAGGATAPTAQAVLRKPCDLDELFAMVERYAL